MQRVDRQQLRKFQVVGDTTGVLEVLVERAVWPGDRDVVPELFPKLRDAGQRLPQARLIPRHPDVVPEHGAEFAVKLSRRLGSLDRQQPLDAGANRSLGFLEGVVIGRDRRQRCSAKIVAQACTESRSSRPPAPASARWRRGGWRRDRRNLLRRAREGPGSCSSGCSQPTGRPSCSGSPDRSASAPCTDPRR